MEGYDSISVGVVDEIKEISKRYFWIMYRRCEQAGLTEA
jgi:hypothetical protein